MNFSEKFSILWLFTLNFISAEKKKEVDYIPWTL